MEEEPEHPEKEPQQACSVYRPNRYRLGLVFLRRQRLSVCCRRSKPLTNKLPYDSGGVYCITGSPSLPQQSASWRGRQSTLVNYNNTRRRSSRPRSANPIFHISSPLSHPCLQKARYYMSLRSLNSIVVKQSHIFYINYINNIHCKQKILHKNSSLVPMADTSANTPHGRARAQTMPRYFTIQTLLQKGKMRLNIHTDRNTNT